MVPAAPVDRRGVAPCDAKLCRFVGWGGFLVEQRIIGSTGSTGPAVRRIRVEADSAGQRLDNFLTKTLKGVPKTHLYRVIRSGEVRVNSGRASADTRLAVGDEIRIPPVRVAERPDRPAAPARVFPVVHEDAHLIVIDKPAGVAVHGGSGESFGVIEQLRRSRPDAAFLELVHRLDKETSGLLLVAKTRAALLALQNDLRSRAPERAVGKTYAALVVGAWPDAARVIDAPLYKYVDAGGARRVRVTAPADEAGRRSITLVQVAERFGDRYTLLEVTIKTGRTHQIRVHVAHAGHPVAGDPKYGDFAANRALARGTAVAGLRFERMFLHASRLRFTHPSTGAPTRLAAPLPAPCRRLVEALRTAP